MYVCYNIVSKVEQSKVMPLRLTNFLNPKTLEISLSDIAQGIDQPVGKLYLSEKDWKWANIFLVVVEGAGGRFCSYRVLQCWLSAVIELLTNCMDWQTLATLIEVTEWELQHYNYPSAHEKQLREVLAQQKVRLEELIVQASSVTKAWEWARAWEPVLLSCNDEPTLDIAVQLFTTQTRQFAQYTDAIAWVQQVGLEHRASFK